MSKESSNTLVLNTENFDELIIQAGKPAIVDFWGDNCAPCDAIAPTIDEIAEEYADKYSVGTVKVEDAMELAAKYGVRGTPTILYIIDGEVKTRLFGVHSKTDFLATMDSLLADENSEESKLMIQKNDLLDAIMKGEMDKVKTIAAESPKLIFEIWEGGNTALGIALFGGRHKNIVEYLLSIDAAVSHWDMAALGRVDDLEKAIKEDSEKLSARNPTGFTALHVAAMNDQCEAIKTLLSLGIDPDIESTGQIEASTLELVVATTANFDSIKMLIEAGADVKRKVIGGGAYLHLAVNTASVEKVKYFLDRGVDPTMTDDEGKTALDVAKEREMNEVAEFLANL